VTEQSTTKPDVILNAHETAIDLANRSDEAKLNEADTRHQIIDVVLHNVLSWPRERTACETHISPGYADYVLARTDKTPILVVEAKKEGHYFTLPGGISDPSQARSVQVKTLLTDAAIKAALTQVHGYCVNTGSQFASITNGHQWIFFRVFQPGQDWRNLHAHVVT
jgi:predicted type IV restriction endonuclease